MAHEDRGRIVAAVAIGGDAALAADADAVIVAAKDEVDDAGDGVRAVDRRIAAGDDVDPLEQIGRDRVDVDDILAGDRRDVAAAVDEDQRARGTLAAKVELVEAGGADELGRVGLAEGGAKRRQLIEGVAQ